MILLILGFAGLLLLCCIAYMIVSSYLEGDSFRRDSVSSINSTSPHLQVDINKNLQIDGSTLALPEFVLQSKDEQQKLSLEMLQLDLNRFALFNRLIHVEEASIKDLDLTLNLDTLQWKGMLPKAGRESSSFMPNKWQIDAFTSSNTSTKLIINSEAYRYHGYHIQARPTDSKNKNWELLFKGGTIETPFFWLERAQLDAGKILISPESIRLESTSLSLAPGNMQLRGLYKIKSGDWLTRLRARKAPIAKLLDNDWKKRITGELDASIELRGKKERLELLTGSINLLHARAEALPFISELKIGNSYPYRSIGFNQASANIRYPYTSQTLGISKAWLIDDIVIHAQNKILIKGYILIKQNRALSGTLDIALPSAIHRSIPLFQLLIKQQIFSEEDEDGHCWVKVNLSGTTDAPREDLSARLKTVLEKQLTNTGSNLLNIFNSGVKSVLPRGEKEVPSTDQSDEESTSPTLIDQGIEGSRQLVEDGLQLFL